MMISRRGFTMVELMTVMTMVGVLATLALPRYITTREHALTSSMQQDLKTLASAQEAFYTVNNDYAGSLVTGPEVNGTGGAGRVNFKASPGNIVIVTYHTGAHGAGWSATATNPEVNNRAVDVCGIFMGHLTYSPSAAVIREGTPTCY